LDRASLVDFCNQHNPRAPPRDRLIPTCRGRWAARSHALTAPREGRTRFQASLRSSEPCERLPAEVSRARGGRLSSIRAPRAALALPRAAPGSSTPTRSARTPLVARPLRRRLIGSSRGVARPSRIDAAGAPLSERRRFPRSRHAPPYLVRGMESRRPSSPRLRDARTDAGPLAREPPRRGQERAAPEVPSIDERSLFRRGAEAPFRWSSARPEVGRSPLPKSPPERPGSRRVIHRMFPTWG